MDRNDFPVTQGWILTGLIATASLSGLALDDLYRDNLLVRSGWWGNDLVTALLAVPLLVGALLFARGGSLRGALVVAGLQAYALYGYAFYLFGAAFNPLFLLYVGVVATATVGLVGSLTSRHVRRTAPQVQVRARDRRCGWVVLGIASVLGLFWIVIWVGSAVSGRVPAMVTATGHPTNVAGALDLWMVVTFGVWGGGWLVRGRGWGLLISAVWAVKGAVYMVALSAATLSAWWAGATGSPVEVALWAPLGVACTVVAGILLGSPELARPPAALDRSHDPAAVDAAPR